MKQLLLESPRAFVLHPSAFIQILERETRLELATLALARRCSTTELLPLIRITALLKEVAQNVPLFLPLCPEALETCGNSLEMSSRMAHQVPYLSCSVPNLAPTFAQLHANFEYAPHSYPILSCVALTLRKRAQFG